MDVISHGLWTNFIFRTAKQTKKIALLAVFFGTASDIFSLGLDFMLGWTGLGEWLGIPTISGNWRRGAMVIPHYIYTAYNILHSLVIFIPIFFIIWLARKRKFFWPMFAWLIHILIDIPSHSAQFFPTPFLWPISDYTFNGVSWATPWFYYSNLALLGIAYLWLFFRGRKNQKETIVSS